MYCGRNERCNCVKWRFVCAIDIVFKEIRVKVRGEKNGRECLLDALRASQPLATEGKQSFKMIGIRPTHMNSMITN